MIRRCNVHIPHQEPFDVEERTAEDIEVERLKKKAYDEMAALLQKSIDDMNKRIKQIQEIRGKLSSSIGEANTATTDTCDVYKQIKANYLLAGSAPTDEIEHTLPQGIQDGLIAARKKHAEVRFTNEENVFKALFKHPILECFEDKDPVEEIKRLTDLVVATKHELTDALQGLMQFMDTVEIQLVISRTDFMNTRLAFNAPYINNGAKSATEGFDTQASEEMTADDLLIIADGVIDKATLIYDQLQVTKATIGRQKSVSRKLELNSATNPIANVN
jgi:hypothetical protein